MANWGLIIFLESSLLYNEKKSTNEDKERVDYLVTHQIAHMVEIMHKIRLTQKYLLKWFADLVTVKWWNDLWLKEAFANLISDYVVNHLEPGRNKVKIVL